MSPSDLADLEEPSKAAAAAGPADEKFETDDGGSSCFFLLPPKREPRNRSLSFFFFSLSFSLSLSFFELKNPPFFSFSFSFSFSRPSLEPAVEIEETAVAAESVRVSGTVGGADTASLFACCCEAIPGGTADRCAGGAIPGGRSYVLA